MLHLLLLRCRFQRSSGAQFSGTSGYLADTFGTDLSGGLPEL